MQIMRFLSPTINKADQLKELQVNMQVDYDYKIEEICNLTCLKKTRKLFKELVGSGALIEYGKRRSKCYKRVR